MKTALKSLAIGVVASLAFAGPAMAAPVTCSGTGLFGTGIRSVVLDDGDSCVGVGNLSAPQSDAALLATTASLSGIAPSQLSLIERDTSALNGGVFQVSTMNLGLFGPSNFTIAPSVWNSNQSLFLYVGLPVGLTGIGANLTNPDYFIFRLNRNDVSGTLSGQWAGLPSLFNANSFALVGQIPEPSSIALVALALGGLGVAARRRSKKR